MCNKVITLLHYFDLCFQLRRVERFNHVLLDISTSRLIPESMKVRNYDRIIILQIMQIIITLAIACITLAIGDLRLRLFFDQSEKRLAIAIHDSRLDICLLFIIETQTQLITKRLCSHVTSSCIETKIEDNVSWKNVNSYNLVMMQI